MLPVLHIQMDLQSTQLHKIYATAKTKMKKYNYINHWTWQNITATVFHSIHDVHKFIAAQNMFWILRSTEMILQYKATNIHTHLTKYLQCWNSYKCNIYIYIYIYIYIKYNLILKRCESFINTSQQYERSPVCTPLCTFRLYALLNVSLTHHSNMDAPQYVQPYVPSDSMLYWMFY